MYVILNIGPKYTRDDSNMGGIVVLFENWVDFCLKQATPSVLIDSNKKNYLSKPLALYSIIYRSLTKMSKVDLVMIHGTLNDYQWLAPVLVWIAKKKGKKIILRKFAGNLWQYYESIKGYKKKLMDFALMNADILFWETQKQVSYFSNVFPDKKSCWFTNVRIRMPYSRSPNQPFLRKFVYISRVEKLKGVDNLREAFNKLGFDYHLDIYGPLIDYCLEDLKEGNYTYKGLIQNDLVNSVLVDYDVLILPTQWKTEGYPGIIMECFNAGIPVIATNVGGIPELIKNEINGLLINPSDTQAIINAVLKLDVLDYSILSKNAKESFKIYDSEIVNNKILNIINNL